MKNTFALMLIFIIVLGLAPLTVPLVKAAESGADAAADSPASTAVFSENFESGIGSWVRGDTDSNNGLDTWGTTAYNNYGGS